MKFFCFALLLVFYFCRITSSYTLHNDNDDDDGSFDEKYLSRSLTSEQLSELSQYLARRLNQEPSFEVSDSMLPNSYDNRLTKRDALWTTTEVLECVRRLKYAKNASKLDLVTEMLNCYRRLRHNG